MLVRGDVQLRMEFKLLCFFDSKELRAALGMGKDDLPPYIYQMRMLGYPPGHLEAAKIAGSGLNMSGTKRRTGSDDSDLEDGWFFYATFRNVLQSF